MAEKTIPEPDDPEQSRRFVDTARSLEVDESGKVFDRAFGIVKTNQAKERHSDDDKTEAPKR